MTCGIVTDRVQAVSDVVIRANDVVGSRVNQSIIRRRQHVRLADGTTERDGDHVERIIRGRTGADLRRRCRDDRQGRRGTAAPLEFVGPQVGDAGPVGCSGIIDAGIIEDIGRGGGGWVDLINRG